MTKQKLNPELHQAFTELFKGLYEKSSVTDYPCKDVPCEYWWVRYAVACTYLKEAHDKIWQPKIKEIKAKYGLISFSYQGHFNFEDCCRSKKLLKAYETRKIIITWKDSEGNCQERAMTNYSGDDELFIELDNYIQESEKVQWQNCPYEMDKQSKCPFYKVSEFYKQRFMLNAQEKSQEPGEYKNPRLFEECKYCPPDKLTSCPNCYAKHGKTFDQETTK
jgi:hypothetical protein